MKTSTDKERATADSNALDLRVSPAGETRGLWNGSDERDRAPAGAAVPAERCDHPASSRICSPTADRDSLASRDAWFLEEVHPHESGLRSYLRNCFPRVRDVEDVIQESYLRIWKAHVSHPIRSTKSFLFKVARHIAIDVVRREKVSPVDHVTDSVSSLVSNGAPSALDVACTRDEVALLVAAIDTLPDRCREIVILRKLHGVSQKDIAARLGVSEQTVQVQALRGVKRVEAYFSRYIAG